MALTLKQAKALFILSKGSDEVMQKYYVDERKEFLKLDIDPKTKNGWLNEMIENGVRPYSDGGNLMMTSLYEAHALFDLANGEKSVMGRGYWDEYLEYKKLVSDELHQKWRCELIDSYYNKISQKEHIDIQEFRHFLELAEYPSIQDNYDRALGLMGKITLMSDEDRFRLVRGLLGVRSVTAQDGLVFLAYKYKKMDDVSRFMITAYQLMEKCRETASENMLGSIEYYTKKWEEMMDILGLDKTACIEEARRGVEAIGGEMDS